jgi:hypothetical protein
MIDTLVDVGEAIKDARPDSLTKLYKVLGIKVSYRYEEGGGEAVISLVVANVRVRGGTPTRKRGRRAAGTLSCRQHIRVAICLSAIAGDDSRQGCTRPPWLRLFAGLRQLDR